MLDTKGSCLESRLRDKACSTDFTFPLARWAPMQPATIDPTLDLCTRYPLWLGGLRQCGIWSLPDTSTHGQHWESNPRPSDLESDNLSTGPNAPKIHHLIHSVLCKLFVHSICLEWNAVGMLDTSFGVFCEGLANNTALQILDLRNNQINHEGVTQLGAALKRNTTLRGLGKCGDSVK